MDKFLLILKPQLSTFQHLDDEKKQYPRLFFPIRGFRRSCLYVHSHTLPVYLYKETVYLAAFAIANFQDEHSNEHEG